MVNNNKRIHFDTPYSRGYSPFSGTFIVRLTSRLGTVAK